MALLTTPRSPLVLTGFMGCGKSTVGRVVAQRLGWHFSDLDEHIEAAAGLSIPAIFAQRGEPAFRELERRELLMALGGARARRTVLALGGGTVAQPQNWEAIREAGGVSVFLDVPVEELLSRCAGIANRPLFRDAESFGALYEHRLPFYRQADVSVAAGGNSAIQVADRILESLEARTVPRPA